MKMKDLQLLGILVLITGGIIVLALLRSSGSAKQTASLREPPAPGFPRRGASGDSLDDWLRLTETPDQQRQRTSSAGKGAGGSFEIKGAGAQEVTVPPTSPAGPEDKEKELSKELEEKQPEQIPLKPLEQQPGVPTTVAPAEAQQIHVVQKGETLSSISRKYYNTAAKWKLILEANKNVISKPEALRPNMKLVIPKLESAQAGAMPPASQTPSLGARALAPGAKSYEVQKGDSLWVIAQKVYGDGTAWKRILEANADQIKSPEELRPGMRLVLP